MARNHANNGRIYRAVITTTHLDGSSVSTRTAGPYDTRGAAKAQISSAEHQAAMSLGKYRDPAYAHSVTCHIETAEVIWQRDSEAKPNA